MDNEDLLSNIRPACDLVIKSLDFIAPHVRPGVSTGKLDSLLEEFIRDHHAEPAPLLVGFPKATCISLNHTICHGIPSYSEIIGPKDILNIDISLRLKGYFGDASRMYHGGNPSRRAMNLMQATFDALQNAVLVARPGNHIGDIGHAIQAAVEQFNYSVVRDYTGHGIGTQFHTDPIVRHYGNKGEGQEITPGMCFTIEPMINIGKHESRTLNDGWTVVTRDLSLSAQWEHQIFISEDGPIVLAR